MGDFEMSDVLSGTQNSIVYAEVNGFVEKKYRLLADYLYVVEIFWSNNQTTYVKRSYKEFLNFHERLKDYFRSKVATEEFTTPVYIPNISSTKPFQKFTRDLAEEREEELHNFLKQLLQGNPMIACNKIVVDFFLSRPSDPVPCREPPDGAASDSITQVVTSDVNDETDEEEDVDVLFERYRPKDTIWKFGRLKA